MLILTLAVALVYSNAGRGPFFLDDIENIVDNPAIRRLWPLSSSLNPPPIDMTFYTRPFINLTMCVDYALWGLNPRGYRLTNILFHLAASLTLFGLLRRAFRAAGREEDDARLLALAGALLWTVHPLNTSAVNCLSQRGEICVGLFFFLMLLSIQRSVGARHPFGWHLLAGFVCLLGMGSKEAMAAAPLLAAAYDRIFLSTSWKEVFRKRGPLYLLLAATWMWPLSRQLAYSPHVPAKGFVPVAFRVYPLAQAWGLVRMISLAVWPDPLIVDYGTNMPTHPSQVWFQLLLIFLMALATIWALKRYPRVGFLGLCFFALLAPSSSFFPIIGQPVAEHRMYAPLAALTTMAAVGVAALCVTWGKPKAANRTLEIGIQPRRLFLGLTVAWALVLGLVSHRRNAVYQNAITLWNDTVAKRPSNGRAWNNYGIALAAAGRFEEALAAYRQAARLDAHLPQTHGNVGNALCSLGRHEEALPFFQEALRVNPSFAPAHSNYGNALSALGRHEEALVHHLVALRLNPEAAPFHYNAANTLIQLGRHEEALERLREAVRLNPGYVEAWNNLGNCLEMLGRPEEAEEAYRQALRQQPGSAPAAGNLGLLLLESGRRDEALAVFTAAERHSRNPAAMLNEIAGVLIHKGYPAEGLELSLRVLQWQPDHPLALNNAAWVMAVSTNEALRDGARAVEFAARAAERLGDHLPSALDTLAAAYAEAGRFDEAVAVAERAVAMARANGDGAFAEKTGARLALYREGKSWRE